MKKYLIILAILNVVLFTQCKQESEIEPKQMELYDLDAIKGRWRHSYEENENAYSVYRPSNYKKFPPSRFRQYFDFKDNNLCFFWVLASDDGHYEEEGVWTYDESTNTITIMMETVPIYKFIILELKEDILKLKMMSVR